MILLANPPGPDLSGLLAEMFADEGLTVVCLENRLIPFGRGKGGSYNPVCFDLNENRMDPSIVLLDHEEILCNFRIKRLETLALNFDNLVQKVVSVKQS
jgi:hypothetical protein